MSKFHVLGIPHTVTTPEYSTCAFTQKVLKLCTMLTNSGHQVIHYGHEKSIVDCMESVTVTTDADLKASYGNWNWRKGGWPAFKISDPIYLAFYANTIREIKARAQPGDFLLCPFGAAHRPVADACKDLIVVESGIGYPSGSFAQFRVFESYALLHAYQGQKAVETASNTFWHDAVIPNAFNVDDFKFTAKKDDYFLFLGRVNAGKGVHVAAQIAEATQTPLVVAGPGDFDLSKYEPWVQKVGVVNPKKRAKLLSKAKAVLCPSTFLEPFCGVQIEAMLSGTPVISSDWGAFAEYNQHGLTGYRCKTFEHFTWAANNIGKIKPPNCRAWGERFSLENIAPLYNEYFQSVANGRAAMGWYTEKPERTDLDNVTF